VTESIQKNSKFETSKITKIGFLFQDEKATNSLANLLDTIASEDYLNIGSDPLLDTRKKYKTLIESLKYEDPKTEDPVSIGSGENKYEEKALLVGTNKIVQIALVVEDIREAQKAWCELLGAESSTIFHSGFEAANKVATYKGQEAIGRSHFTFIDTPHIQVELIQPDKDSRSTWLEQLENNGESLHHIAFKVDDLDEKVKLLNSVGFPTIQEGPLYDGLGKYAYIDTTSDYSVIFELKEMFK